MPLPLIPKPDLIKILKDRYARLTQFMVRELTRSLNGAYPQIEAAKVQGKINDALRQMDIFAAGWAKTAVTRAYTDSARRTKVQLEMIGARRPAGQAPGRIHGENMAGFTARIYGDLKKANVSAGRTAQTILAMVRTGFSKVSRLQEFEFNPYDLDEVEGLFEEWATEAVLKQQARATLSGRIIDYLRNQIEEGDFVEVNGRHFSVAYYAEMVARTMLREAQTSATKAMCLDYENDLVEFSTHNKPCDECAELEGQVFSISGTHPIHAPLTAEEEPPLHPNCEHSLSPTSDVAISFREAEA